MATSEAENYYVNMKPKLMKDFKKTLKLVKKILRQYFDESKTAQILEESRRQYEALIPQLAYIGGKKNVFTFNLVGGALMLAVIRPLEREGLTTRDIGKIVYETLGIYFESKPYIMKWLAGKLMTSKSYIKKMKKQAESSQLRCYPGDWVFKFIKGDAENFDFGLDMTECGIQKFYKEHGVEKYVPYLCLGDYPMLRAFGVGLIRTQTLGHGAPKCDFKFKKGGKTLCGWPLGNLEEFRNTEKVNLEG